MNMFHTIIVIIQVISALVIIGLVLLQQGKGADMGAAFGSGASGSLFGATGSSNFLSKSTGVAATIFFGATLALAFIGNRPNTGAGVMDRMNEQGASVPATPAVDPSIPAVSGSVPAVPAAPANSGSNADSAAGNGATGGGQSTQIPK